MSLNPESRTGVFHVCIYTVGGSRSSESHNLTTDVNVNNQEMNSAPIHAFAAGCARLGIQAGQQQSWYTLNSHGGGLHDQAACTVLYIQPYT